MSGESDNVEQKALSMGWVPQEKFKGNPDHWVSAEEFVERGEKMMPILLANNRRMQAELSTRDAKIDTLSESLERALKAQERLEAHYTAANKRAVENAKLQLKEELKLARENNDVDAELDIQDRLAEIRKVEESEPAEDKKKEESKSPPTPTLSAELQAWQAENSWFGQDKKKTKAFNRLAEDIRDEGETDLVGRPFLDFVLKRFEESQEEPENRPVSKVESSGPRRGSGGSRSFASLPQEAKQACWDDAESFVGPNLRYKTMKEWEDKYASVYYSEE